MKVTKQKEIGTTLLSQIGSKIKNWQNRKFNNQL